ncbi:methyltransferase domain-containing protein [Streptomyces graminifolii]|uniref:methyltransferase domain-containing protein n=1 Tax=Streptomyces graminifolii TaxID=1266771 RepID=UPI0040590102
MRVTTASSDLWHHYGRTRAKHDREVPDTFRWIWSQDSGPGPETLGNLTGAGRRGDLGAGSARHAAHLVVHHEAVQVVAVDPSPEQYEMAADLFGHLEPRLRIVLCDAVSHLKTTANTYDVLYSVFGALDFTDPRDLLPAAFFALKPGGRLVFSTLAHYIGGAPAQPDVVAASVLARTPEGEAVRTPEGEAATMHRWVLQEHVWVKVLDEAGFTGISVDMLPSAVQGPRAADTLLMTATRRP